MNRNRTPIVVAAVVVVVLVIGLVVVLATRGDDDGDDAATPAAGNTVADGTDGGAEDDAQLPAALEGELRPLTVEGEALPVFGDGDDEAIGQVAPVLTGESFDGEVVTTAAGGRPVMIVVLAHWCPHCNNEIPRLVELNDSERLPQDLRVVGVSTAVSPDAPNFPPSEWLAEKDWPFEAIADYVDFDDGTYLASDALGVSGFPFVVIVDGDGEVVTRWSGESDVDELQERIADAVSG